MKKITALLTPVLALASFTVAASAGSEKDVALPPPPPPSCAWTLGVSALYLEADSEFYNNQDYEFAYRLDLMYDNGGLFGYRLSYFNFEGTDYTTKSSQSRTRYYPEVSAIDLELVGDLSVAGFEGSYSFGLRYLEFENHHGTHSHLNFDGWGPTVGVDLVRPINDTLGFYVHARASWVFGEDAYNDYMDDLLVIEAGAGIQYNFGGCDSFVRLGLEAQRYFDVRDGDTDDVDLVGAALRVGFRF